MLKYVERRDLEADSVESEGKGKSREDLSAFAQFNVSSCIEAASYHRESRHVPARQHAPRLDGRAEQILLPCRRGPHTSILGIPFHPIPLYSRPAPLLSAPSSTPGSLFFGFRPTEHIRHVHLTRPAA